MILPEKLVSSSGEVAVMISGAFGAGWSTWSSEKGQDEFLLFDKTLITMKERSAGEAEVEEYILSKGWDYVYMGGWGNVGIEWLPQGTPFKVTEYDGHENLITQVDLPYIA